MRPTDWEIINAFLTHPKTLVYMSTAMGFVFGYLMGRLKQKIVEAENRAQETHDQSL